jgi:peptidoglycan-associated lipoprotein
MKMNLVKTGLILLMMAGVAGCSKNGDTFGSGGTGAGGMNGVNGMNGEAGGMIDEHTISYFNSNIADTVLFPVDQAVLTPEAMAILNTQAGWLNQNQAIQILIEGHADEQGTREYNIALGGRRAEAVRAYLISQGVLDSRIRIRSYGKERPLAICSDETCWSRNRRAVTVVTGGIS